VRLFLSLFLFTLLLSSKSITSSSTSTKDSKKEACQEATKQAQKQALEESGINIFSSFKMKKVLANKKIEKIISNSIQSSYGLVKRKSIKESISFNEKTSQITCIIDGIFEVDTSNLKHQMKALKLKYENEYKEEVQRKRNLVKKEKILKKYGRLTNKITRKHTFKYNNSYNCGDNMNLSNCKKEIKKEIKLFFKKKLAKKYHISSSYIEIGDITFYRKIKIKPGNSLRVSYNGNISSRAIKVKNPYSKDIENINIEDEKINIDYNEKLGLNIKSNDNTKKINDYIYFSYEFHKNSKSFHLNYKKSLFVQSFFMTLGIGVAKYNNYKYNVASLGLSYFISNNLSLDIESILPYTKLVNGKPFMELSANIQKNISKVYLSIGIKSSGRDKFKLPVIRVSIGSKI